jgi:hypothetical protein
MLNIVLIIPIYLLVFRYRWYNKVMKKFEYKICQIAHKALKQELNDLGSLGWDLIQYNKEGESIFKRQIDMSASNDLGILNDQFSDEVTLEKIKKVMPAD